MLASRALEQEVTTRMSSFNDPLTQAAFAIHQNKGVFALLLGSGVSRSAEIPTGWEITLDLVRRVAEATGAGPQVDWEKWYIENEKASPDYSNLLAQLTTTPAERRAVLDGYIEPNVLDISEGRKVPTSAHKAIAKLVKSGHIKVILTTNFDRLLERALRDEGVEPTIVSSSDSLKGAEPVTHCNCFVFKLHGDYKDTRILNTTEELEGYPEDYNNLLDRIFDEYGLIICGWSGEWDHALRNAITRTPNRRYPLFWAMRGLIRGAAKDLFDLRKGLAVQISDADKFFTELTERVQTLDLSRSNNPASIDLLLNMAKRYLSTPEHRIQFSDLVSRETNAITERLDREDMATFGPYTSDELKRRLDIYKGSAEGLCKISGLTGRWGDEEALSAIIGSIRLLWRQSESHLGGLDAIIELRRYPIILLYQSLALGLLKAKRWRTLKDFFGLTLPSDRYGDQSMVDAIAPIYSSRDIDNFLRLLPEYRDSRTPLEDHILQICMLWGASFLGSNIELEDDYDFLGMLTVVSQAERLEKLELKSLLNSTGAGKNYGHAVFSRAMARRISRSRGLKRLESQDLQAELRRAGYFGGDEEFLTLAILNFKRGVEAHARW